MAFNVDVFKNSGLIYGGARPSLFQVDLTFPAELSRSIANRRFSFTCRATSIPSSTVQAVEVPYFGRTVKLAGDRTFDNWNVTVMNDEDYTVRNAFEDWSNALNSMVGNQRLISVGTSGAGRAAGTAAGGALAAVQAQDALKRLRSGDKTGAEVSAVGAGGSGLSTLGMMARMPKTGTAGAALSAGSMGVNFARDFYNATPEERKAMIEKLKGLPAALFSPTATE